MSCDAARFKRVMILAAGISLYARSVSWSSLGVSKFVHVAESALSIVSRTAIS